jgi:hypothetical protein
MGKIYTSADQAIVYVGESWPDKSERNSDRAMQIIADPEAEAEFFNDPCLSFFFNRPWFCRTWVVQEVARSKYAAIICGRETVP